ncbi:MAG: thioredoxin TrxA [Novosphingobium sp.]
MPMKIVTDDSFSSEVLNAEKAVLVDFWATWCGPCKMIAPSLEELSEEFGDTLVIAKMDVDQSPATAAQYGIRGVPTLILFKDGKPVATKVGPAPKSQLKDFISQAL